MARAQAGGAARPAAPAPPPPTHRPAAPRAGPLPARCRRAQCRGAARCWAPCRRPGTPGGHADRRALRPHSNAPRAASASAGGGGAVSTAPELPKGRDFFNWLMEQPWQKMGVWLVVVLLAYQLKDFFGIAMGTFIVSFIGNGFVRSAQRSVLLRPIRSEQWRRRLLVLIYFTGIVSLIAIFGGVFLKDIIREGADFVSRLQSDNIWVVVLEKMRHGLGDGVMEQLERLLLAASGAGLTNVESAVPQEWTMERTAYLGHNLQVVMHKYTEAAVSLTSGLVTFVSRFAVQVGVSLVLSFMVVWDLPTIAGGVATLKTSRLSAIYKEVAPSLTVFGQLFGKALQAQARIALVNAALTSISIWYLKIPGIGLLSLFVFLCSFIPIAGCFISTVPIAFVALTEYGFMKLALVIVSVIFIHIVEAYGLNPAIYSAHLKLHPLLVLTVLVVAEHSLGVWGLLLAVPLTVFALDYCIRYPACSMTDVAARELLTVSVSDFDEEFKFELKSDTPSNAMA